MMKLIKNVYTLNELKEINPGVYEKIVERTKHSEHYECYIYTSMEDESMLLLEDIKDKYNIEIKDTSKGSWDVGRGSSYDMPNGRITLSDSYFNDLGLINQNETWATFSETVNGYREIYIALSKEDEAKDYDSEFYEKIKETVETFLYIVEKEILGKMRDFYESLYEDENVEDYLLNGIESYYEEDGTEVFVKDNDVLTKE